MLKVSAYLEGEQGEGERDRLSKRNYIYSLPVINLIILGLFFFRLAEVWKLFFLGCTIW